MTENINYNLENTNKEKGYEETNKKVDEAISELSKMDSIKYLPLPRGIGTAKQLSDFLRENNIRNLKKIRGNLEKQEQILKIMFPNYEKYEKNRKEELISKLETIDTSIRIKTLEQIRERFFSEEIQKIKEQLRLIILSKDKKEIKKHIKELINKMEEFGIGYYDNNKYNKSRNIAPIFWSNGGDGDGKLSKNNEYNLKAEHYYYDDNERMSILWNIVENAIKYTGKLDIDGTYCKEMFEKGGHIPYDKLLSEVWVETMPIEDITNGELRIEFGQNINGRKANEVFFATDAVLAVSELPILLDRIAQHNIENPGNEVYLKNVGVSLNEINSGKFEDISGRYGKGENSESKNNEGANLIIVEAVERDEVSSEILQEHNKTVLSLKYLILKREKQRLKKCIKRLEKEENKEKTLEDLNIDSWSDNENEQHNFIEKARKKQEIDYSIEKDLKQKNFSTDEEKESFIKERKKELKEEFKTKKFLVDKSEEDDFIKWTAKHQEELEKKEEEKVKSLQDKIKEILEQGEQNIGKSQTQLVSERGEESKNQASEIMV